MQPGRDCERKWKSCEDILQVRHHKLLPGGQASVFITKKLCSNTETPNTFASVGAKSSRYKKTKIFTTETFTKKNLPIVALGQRQKGIKSKKIAQMQLGPRVQEPQESQKCDAESQTHKLLELERPQNSLDQDPQLQKRRLCLREGNNFLKVPQSVNGRARISQDQVWTVTRCCSAT